MKLDDYSYGYKREPPAVKKLWLRYEKARRKAEKKGRKDILSFNEVVLRELGLTWRKFLEVDGNGVEFEIERWCKLYPFKPSKDQVVRYLKWKQEKAKTKGERLKYAVPLTLKTKKETTGKDELVRIWNKTDDPVIGNILRIRSINKMLRNDIPNWEPGEDGRVHSTFKYGPPTGQFNAVKPNVLNASKHSALGQKFRKMVAAPKGFVLIEFDYSRFHIATMGRESEDASYIRFGRLDCHSILTAWMVGWKVDLDWEDEKIKEVVRKVRADPKLEEMRNEKCKHTILGNQQGLGPYKLQRAHRDHIRTIKEAKELQAMIARKFPKVEATKRRIVQLAQEQKFLLSKEFGVRREFYDVLTPKWNRFENRWTMAHGTEYEKAMSFFTQTNAFGMIKLKLIEMDDLGWLGKWGFINTVHDSLVFMPRIEEWKECAREVRRVMMEPCKRLANKVCPEGLQVAIDVEVGKNWATWDKVKNPKGMREVKF